MAFLVITYLVPILSMMYTYARIGIELWGSQSIGECTQRQMENIKSKRRVSAVGSNYFTLGLPSTSLQFIFKTISYHLYVTISIITSTECSQRRDTFLFFIFEVNFAWYNYCITKNKLRFWFIIWWRKRIFVTLQKNAMWLVIKKYD